MTREERTEMIAEWFKDHIAERTVYRADNGKEITCVRWGRPNTGNYRVTYIARDGVLVVNGDLEDAIYYAGADGLAFWASCDLSYFASKCLASDKGRGYKSWDSEEAVLRANEHWRRGADEALDGHARERNRHQHNLFIERFGIESVENEQEWNVWLGQHGHEVFGDAFYEFAYFGRVIDLRCEAHLIGLKMALAQLAKAAAA